MTVRQEKNERVGHPPNIMSWTGTGQQVFNRSYVYDPLNRLSTLSDSTSGNPCPGLSWSYDAWGNRTDQNVTSGSCGASHLTINTQNRITNTGIQYDAAGNMTNDGTHTYTYDAENRLTTVNGGITTSYLRDLSGNVVGELDGGCGATCWARGLVYFNNQLLGKYDAGTTSFVSQDHLGSTRLVTGVGQTQIVNGGFEQGLTSWSTNGTLVTNAANAHSGNNYVLLSSTGQQVTVQGQTLAVNPGDQLTFGGWVFLESGTGGPIGTGGWNGWWLAVYDAHGDLLP